MRRARLALVLLALTLEACTGLPPAPQRPAPPQAPTPTVGRRVPLWRSIRARPCMASTRAYATIYYITLLGSAGRATNQVELALVVD